MRLNIATCRPLPEPDVDEDLLLEALQAVGVEARMAAWDDAAQWREPVPTLVRSTWNYIHALDAFAGWVREVAAVAPLWNSASVLLGNLHKRYLLELAGRGVPVTPTELLTRGWSGSLSELCGRRGWHDVVVKPAVGAASFETYRFTTLDAEVDAQTRVFATQRDLLVQPYLPSVEDYGERALVWIDGEFTHAVRKTPRFAGGVEVVSEAIGLTAAERSLGTAALAPFAADLLYARVDVAPGPDGQPVVMELELIEPSLFLLQSPQALERLVAAVRRELKRL
ncbi:MAG: hypothetical protein FGM43_07380 [Sinobacteraceae bacterium]|nr:hypothetical protein [Nevskiaceae bacterium]